MPRSWRLRRLTVGGASYPYSHTLRLMCERMSPAALPDLAAKDDDAMASAAAPPTSISADRDVSALLRTHASALASLRAELTDAPLQPQHDDLFLLRYVLAHASGLPAAADAVRKTLAWQRDKAEFLESDQPGGRRPPHLEAFDRHVAAVMHAETRESDLASCSAPSTDMLFCMRTGLVNVQAVLAEVPAEMMVDLMLVFRYRVYKRLDVETRRTGRLCKLVSVADLHGASLGQLHYKLPSVLSQVSGLSEVYFPMYQDSIVLMNLPPVLKPVTQAVLACLPKRVQQRVRMCPGRTLTESISRCPFARTRLALERVPAFLGGGCRCPNGCSTAARDAIHPNRPGPINHGQPCTDALTTHVVPARGTYAISLHVQAGGKVAYAAQVQAGVVFSGPVSLQATLRGRDGQEAVVLQPQVLAPEQGTVHGDLVAPQAGSVVFTLSNPSAVWSRSVRFCASLVQEEQTG